MKKIIIPCILAMTSILYSCLDVDQPGNYPDDEAWASIRNLDYNVKSFYSTVLYNGYVSELASPGTLTDAYSDLLKYTRYSEGNSANRLFSVANYLSAENHLSPWSTWYSAIKTLNDFLVLMNNGFGDHLDPAELSVREGEVRLLRAFVYQDLVIRHGGVILRINEDILDGPDESQKARSTKEECWDFVIGEYEKASILLPKTWDSANKGRLTTGAAWGMMARAAIYSGRWDKAIEAAGEVEKQANEGVYALLDNYAQIFTEIHNKELIIPVYYSNNNGHQFDVTAAPSADGTVFIGGLVSPTDEFASSYDIQINGTWQTFYWEEVIKDGIDPWTNRDPRFYQTILYNGASWKDRTIELFVGGTDGFLQYAETGNEDARKSVTGYAIRKFLSTTIDYETINKSNRFWIEMRYAEILLILSEAYARNNDFAKAYEYLNKIRTTRSSVRLPELTQKANWDDYLIDLQKERICELGMEGHRCWDLRRWGIATMVLGGSRTHGVKITKNGSNFKYERVESDARDRIFPEKHNIFPIPYSEVSRNTLCVQDNEWR